jgi:hypothetical protein
MDPKEKSTPVKAQEELPASSEKPQVSSNGHKGHNDQPSRASRRSFIKRAGGLAAVAAMVPLEPLLGGKETLAEASDITYDENTRSGIAFTIRKTAAGNDKVNPGVLPDNGDFAKYADKSGTWSKALIHDSLEIVNQNSFTSFVNALTSTNFNDFENIQVGHPGGTNFNAELNGPQTALAFDLEGLDSHATNAIGPAPTTASAQTADEQVEMYWAAMLRDVNFTDYPGNATAQAAVSELNNLTYIKSSANNEFPFPVTTGNLFRGQIVPGDGNVQGPYLSQFLLQPTFFGAHPLNQMYKVFAANQNFMTSVTEFENVENGAIPSGVLQFDPTLRHFRNGRDLNSFTHVDVLTEAHYIAFLVLAGINAPLNPGNPYGTRQMGGTSIGNKADHGFGTLDPQDCGATLTEMGTRALKAAWFHKWIVNLRQRPEEYGALIQARKTGVTPAPKAAADVHSDVLNSQGLAKTFSQFGTYLLPQAFPEGAPPHPCYPTGHGTVAGACLTAIKFFFDGSQPIQPLLQAAGSDVKVPSEDGLSLVTYTGSDANKLTVNGELLKLAFNISFGHGIHAGIHFRSSTNSSILLGEEVAIGILNDRTLIYNEPFTITITKFDGTTQTFSNAGPSQFTNSISTTTTCTTTT